MRISPFWKSWIEVNLACGGIKIDLSSQESYNSCIMSFQMTTDDAWVKMMSVQQQRAPEVRAEQATFDSIFRPKRQAYPAHCNCAPKASGCQDGPPGPPGPPGHDGRTKIFPLHIQTVHYCIIFQMMATQDLMDTMDMNMKEIAPIRVIFHYQQILYDTWGRI